MLPEIAEIKLCRKSLNLTQKKLSELSGVSQSLIAKIESGKIVPGYNKAKRIFESLEEAGKKKRPKAKHIMSKKLVSVGAEEKAKKAVSLMEKKGYSQLPVMKKNKCIGVITEQGALSALRELGTKKFNSLKVGEIMGEPLPIFSEQTPFRVLAGILNHESAVLVSRKGKVVGIITKANLLKNAVAKT